MNVIEKQQPKKLTGFSKILSTLVVEAQSQSQYNIKSIIKTIVTFNNRLELDVGLRSLNHFELSFYESLEEIDSNDVSFHLTALNLGNKDHLYTIGLKSYGRIMFEKDPNLKKTDLIIGYIGISNKVHSEILERKSSLDDECEKLNKEIYQFYENCTIENAKELVTFVHHTIYHMNPIFIYQENELYSVFYDNNNLIEKLGGGSGPYHLDELLLKPLMNWTTNEKLLVYKLYWLFKSGGPYRGEEFNGQQLTSSNLHKYFDDKIKTYCKAINKSEFININLYHSLKEKSELLNNLRQEVMATHTLCRKVNGLNLYKEEGILEANDLTIDPISNIPIDIESYIKETYKYNIKDYNNFYDFCMEWLEGVFKDEKSSNDPLNFHPFEEMLHVIVKSAVDATNSDIGMSRSLRNYTNLIKTYKDKSFTESSEWATKSFFCCVVPSERMEKSLTNHKGILPGILKAISTRMQFNSWHLWAGNFPEESIPKNRHWVFPSVMPDTGAWTDQHHKGHIFAGVRYAIRCPYKLQYLSQDILSVYDLRLMRQKGNEYTEEDLKIATFYTYYFLKDLYQALLDTIEKSAVEFEVNSFTKKWYENYYQEG